MGLKIAVGLLLVFIITSGLTLWHFDRECIRWKQKAEEAENRRIAAEESLATTAERAEALAENARRCLSREAMAQASASERNAIMNAAKPKERPKQEKELVVDDDTRIRVVDRLNRKL